jgi:hypothetical protein
MKHDIVDIQLSIKKKELDFKVEYERKRQKQRMDYQNAQFNQKKKMAYETHKQKM